MTETFEVRRSAARGSGARRAVTLAAAAVSALAVWTVAVPVAGLDLTVGAGADARSIGPAAVALVPILAGGAGWALLAWLERRRPDGRRVWRFTAWAVLALSLVGPATAGAAAGVVATLVAMHLVVAVTLVVGLAPAPAERTSGR
ncbi:DUF6069 family protein [Micromonospora sp. NPDC050397]|uniref:DUF6069 family protein n=1 Tax=Micromonospora sp. NPDC050397 TaxID=3364279 RepID=UPI00384D50E0